MRHGRISLGLIGLAALLGATGCEPNTPDGGPADLSTGCIDDSMCKAPTPHCNSMTKLCVQCNLDSQCPDGNLCMNHACVPGCSQTKGCGDAGMCDPGTGKCSVCKSDGDCTDTKNPRCESKTGRCVPCLPENDNCGMGMYCVDLNGTYSCNKGCGKDADCRAGDGGGAGSFACCNHVCVDTQADNNNCSTCGKACANGNTCCSGACVDVTSSAANCGACGAACAGANATMACESSKCVVKGCDAGFADCDRSASNGCEVNVDTDPMNCTACGTVCAVANGKAACAKACKVGECDPGFADCDTQYANGCEVNTGTSAQNCGACGTICAAVANANSTCTGGMCAVASCNGNFLDCDKQFANGCEVDGSKDVKNCGACGKACAAVANGTAACTGGACGIGSCNANFLNCDNMAANGCEVSAQTDVNNCGACGKACPAVANGTPGCAAGACGVGSCKAGFADCNMNPNDGCETSLTNDVKNCGSCNKVCPGGMNTSPTCVNSVCGTIACMAPFQDCDAIPLNGCETNTSNDVNNCGACKKVCAAVANGTPGCVAGVCGIAVCTPPFKDCDGVAANGCEVNANTDINNCGACAKKCTVANGTPSCTLGACGISMCNAGFLNCDLMAANGCEVNANTDIANCGACGTKCAVANGTAACTNGACGIGMCNANYANCKNGYADGCETRTDNDLNNCGACAKVCPAVANGTASCVGGACGVASCNANFGNCDGNAANGCEANTATDPKNCGGCGNVCPNGVCNGGVCKDKVLIVGAPGTATWNNDVQAKLLGTGAFATVDIINGNTMTPTLATLKQYQAVLVYSDVVFLDPVTLGNNIADYFDQGGRVVVATFANASVPVTGRWSTGNYQIISPAGQKQPGQAAALQIVDATSPLVTGVATLTSTAAYASSGGVVNGGVAVANWGDKTTPLIVRGVKNGRAIAALNFYPPSSAVRNDFWAGDGATIMKNALLYKGWCHSIVGQNGGACPSGKVEFCDPTAPIVATSSTQAKLACDTCYGISCFAETADCAGAGYGPKPAGTYTCGDAYFGYVAGCSGTAGRIWSICSSYTTYGRWAP